MCAITDAWHVRPATAKKPSTRVSSLKTEYEACRPLRPCRQCGYYGPADTYNGAESRYTSGRRRTNGIRNTGTHHGVYDRKGSLQKGKDADIIVMDEDLKIRAVWAMGKLVPETDTLS